MGSSNFRKKVFALTKEIPEGRVSTYKIIAEKMGTKAFRAVGSALNKNPSNKLPCHRVVCSDGKIGGYNKGQPKKRMLLRKEGIAENNGKIVDFHNKLYRF